MLLSPQLKQEIEKSISSFANSQLKKLVDERGHYNVKIVDGLVTNFHQPGLTLLLLVAEFVGVGWKNIYDYALSHSFRFLSYGDSNLLWRRTNFHS